MADQNIQPYALKAGQGWTYDFFGLDFVVKLGESGQNRRLAVVEYVTRSGEEPPDHSHGTEDESFYVLEGALTFRCGTETFELEDGGYVFLPRGVEHGYTIRSEGEVRLLAITAPAPEASTKPGWGGFVGDFQSDGELRSTPPWVK